MITYLHIYANDQFYGTVLNRDNLATTIRELRSNTGTWITVVETYNSSIETKISMPVPKPSIDELDISPEHKQMLIEILAQGENAICPPLSL